MLNFFARSGLEIEKIDSLWTGRGIKKALRLCRPDASRMRPASHAKLSNLRDRGRLLFVVIENSLIFELAKKHDK